VTVKVDPTVLPGLAEELSAIRRDLEKLVKDLKGAQA